MFGTAARGAASRALRAGPTTSPRRPQASAAAGSRTPTPTRMGPRTALTAAPTTSSRPSRERAAVVQHLAGPSQRDAGGKRAHQIPLSDQVLYHDVLRSNPGGGAAQASRSSVEA